MSTPAAGRAIEVGLQVRREILNRDQINAKNYEHWQTDGKYSAYNRPDRNKVAPHMDVLPNSSRTNNRSYRQAPIYTASAGSADFYRNAYFDGVDIKTDPRNVARELRGAVFEQRDDRGRAENMALNMRLIK